MPAFLGHVLPGTLFLIIGLWMSYKLLEVYFITRRGSQLRSESVPYRSNMTHGLRSLGLFPIEEIVLLIMALIGITGELATGFIGFILSLHNGQHVSMYSMFGILAIFLLLKHYRYPVPDGVEYLILCMCFIMEGLLFHHHLHGRKKLDVMIHMCIIYLCASTSVAVLLELKFRRSILPPLTRCYLITVQGMWFIEAAFILYPPVGSSWDLDDHKQMMKVTIMYVWLFIVGIFALLFLGVISNIQVSKMTVNQLYEALQFIKIKNRSSESDFGNENKDEQIKGMSLLSEEEEL